MLSHKSHSKETKKLTWMLFFSKSDFIGRPLFLFLFPSGVVSSAAAVHTAQNQYLPLAAARTNDQMPGIAVERVLLDVTGGIHHASVNDAIVTSHLPIIGHVVGSLCYVIT